MKENIIPVLSLQSQEIGQFQSASGDLSLISNIPAPADLKRVTVGKDSGQTVLHRAARMGLEVSAFANLNRSPSLYCTWSFSVPSYTCILFALLIQFRHYFEQNSQYELYMIVFWLETHNLKPYLHWSRTHLCSLL